jgi:phosphoribosyl 1,2-cyclic phosphodiesterase
MQYASLASGSSRNCHALSDGETILLIDAGISHLQISNKLKAINWQPQQVQGVAITHEHTDHVQGIKGILKKAKWQILATPDTRCAIGTKQGVLIPEYRWVPLSVGHATLWNNWTILPFAVPHDANDPIAYKIEVQSHRCAVVTDLGCVTQEIVEHCKDLDLLVIESNHDVGMLLEGSYRQATKTRILSPLGHLSNDGCADMVGKVVSQKLKHVVLAHLSQKNNVPALAKLAVSDAIKKSGNETEVHVATQNEVLEVR